ncbi:monoheme cytochrome C [Lutimonas sp.]|uniref:monoheme cytochrome C n=1 Tax=Lutimonas sp. TaxID=1872403 RepID=UPI003D9B0B8F
MCLLISAVLIFNVNCNGPEKNRTIENKPLETSSISSDIVDGIHVRTGLKEGEGLMMVIGHCTACHSAQLITQNRMNKEQWNATIRWMQETQNLWDLGENQEVIVNYLVTNYPVIDTGRRENLPTTEWYRLEDQ